MKEAAASPQSPEPVGPVGRDLPRLDGLSKTNGAARYVDDLVFPGMIYGRTVRSKEARATIRSIRPPAGASENGFTVVDYRDIPGVNVVSLIVDDQPCLVEREIRHVAEPIVLLAHADREKLYAAEVVIETEPLPAIIDYEKSDIELKHLKIERGDVAAGLAAADVVIEGEYRTGHQEQLYIEPNGVIAVPENGGVTIHGSLQCPFYVMRALRVLLNLPDEKLRVVQTATGGGFGGKEEYPSMLACHAALLALKSGRPVKIATRSACVTARASVAMAPLPHSRSTSSWTAAHTQRSHRSCSPAVRCTAADRIAVTTCLSRDAR
jgi:CO/xanthine dehydrogenase Mo-binding subunit